ncbi:hypothetical protein HDU96_003413, partial [Phlyctochytrium bullatum]
KAQFGIIKIKSTSGKFLSTLCNQFTYVDLQAFQSQLSKGVMLQAIHDQKNAKLQEAISAFLLIAEGPSVNSCFFHLVKTLLRSQQPSDAEEQAYLQHRNYLILDLMLIMLPFLPDTKQILASRADEEDDVLLPEESPLLILYKVLLGYLENEDATLQKRTYKGLNMLVDIIPYSQLSVSDLLTKLLDTTVITLASSGVKRSRIKLLQRLFEALSSDLDSQELLLHMIPLALSEVILATKEASEKARSAAFDCIVSFGRQMYTIENRNGRKESAEDLDMLQSDLMDISSGKVELKEFFTMVCAGLAGDSAHMQSATIACLSRMIFEFGGIFDIPTYLISADIVGENLIKELLKTVLFFMQSKNREIIKSVLGFVKVAVVSLPQEYLEDELENIVHSILTHSRDHKSHFKAKVRHIFERLIKRFSLEAVQGFVPESDSRLIINIRKRRERLKKKKALERRQGEGESDADVPKENTANARPQMQSRQKEFEDALHGSESDLNSDSDENDEHYIPHEALGFDSLKTKPGTAMIREEDDVLDFLDSKVVSHITSKGAVSRASKRRRDDSDEFDVNDEGKMVIAEEDEPGNSAGDMEGMTENVENLYLESVQDASFKRLPDGRIKFITNKKAEGRDGKEALGVTTWSRLGSKGKSSAEIAAERNTRDKMLGRHYKAKRADGDVKRSGMPDPYAYIPLSGKIVGNMKKSTQLAPELKGVLKSASGKGDTRSSKRAKTGGRAKK